MLRERHGAAFGSIVWQMAKSSLRKGCALLVPLAALRRGWILSARSRFRRRDWLNFAALDWITTAATLWGMLTGVVELWRAGVR